MKVTEIPEEVKVIKEKIIRLELTEDEAYALAAIIGRVSLTDEQKLFQKTFSKERYERMKHVEFSYPLWTDLHNAGIVIKD